MKIKVWLLLRWYHINTAYHRLSTELCIALHRYKCARYHLIKQAENWSRWVDLVKIYYK